MHVTWRAITQLRSATRDARARARPTLGPQRAAAGWPQLPRLGLQAIHSEALAKRERNFAPRARPRAGRMRRKAVSYSICARSTDSPHHAPTPHTTHHTPPRHQVTTEDELAYAGGRIADDFSNYSAWHYRTILLHKLYAEEVPTGEQWAGGLLCVSHVLDFPHALAVQRILKRQACLWL